MPPSGVDGPGTGRQTASLRRTCSRLLLLALLVGLAAPTVLLQWPAAQSVSAAFSTGRRKLLIRDFPGEEPVQPAVPQHPCNNTLAGRWQVADDRGYVCMRDQLHSHTGCCLVGKQYSCETCDVGTQCCAEYERCVSCCLHPTHNAANVSLSAFRSPDRDGTGRWATPFEYCRGKCRTTSRSTVHENAYLDPLHHCFSPSGKPTTPSPPVPTLPGSVAVVVGDKGQSCTDACAALPRSPSTAPTCAQEHLAALNDCNRLRVHFACEAGCDSEAGAAAEHPGYVVTAAPKHQRPAMCLVDPLGSQGGSCDGANANVQRLCPCIQAPMQTQQQPQAQQQEQQQQAQQRETVQGQDAQQQQQQQKSF